MDKSKKDRLLELRAKKSVEKKESESVRHLEVLNALQKLGELFEIETKSSASKFDELLNKLDEFSAFKDHVSQVKSAIENIPVVKNVSIDNISDIIEAQQDFDVTEVVNALNALTKTVTENSVDSVTIKNKTAEEYIPTRRVRQVQGRLVFDDDPLQVNVVGGGGGTIMTPSNMLGVDIATGQNKPIAVVESVDYPGIYGMVVLNPDGTMLSTGGSTPVDKDNLLLESGDALLLENGSELLLESA